MVTEAGKAKSESAAGLVRKLPWRQNKGEEKRAHARK